MPNTITTAIRKVNHRHHVYLDTVEVEFKDEVKNGKGRFAYSNGDVYNGDWKNNQREGRGIIIQLRSRSVEYGNRREI